MIDLAVIQSEIDKRNAAEALWKQDSGPHEHEDSGWRCLVAHGKGQPQCMRCSVCGQWIERQ